MGDSATTRWKVRPFRGVAWPVFAAEDEEPIAPIVSGDDYMGNVVLPTTATAELAIALSGVEPTDWHPTVWAYDATRDIYRAVGPSPNDLGLSGGLQYLVWLRITDATGVVIRRAPTTLDVIGLVRTSGDNWQWDSGDDLEWYDGDLIGLV